ncbi:MAG: hypothetical protein L0G87_10070 [Renibacterium salmoninarum]|nr:hypothetical protein [Renibacterium salmoninarum]
MKEMIQMSTELNSDTLSGQRRSVRVGTLVWGVVLIAVAALIMVGRYTAVELDPRLVLIALLLLAGLALLVGGVLSGAAKSRERSRNAEPSAEPLTLPSEKS